MGNLLERLVNPNEEEGVLNCLAIWPWGACLACLAHGDTLQPDKDKSHNRRKASVPPAKAFIDIAVACVCVCV
ncbi:hypothetical protein CEP51_002096 [Fusarium floridanum]|uniref:Uncharacterized protein n=1 Tax=Fusarium floridanum TaxID=1325733 RepID=A0A428SD76_9HYPO|nr:hypothetical protein CEP51_002096 [Fusarium floridanum]